MRFLVVVFVGLLASPVQAELLELTLELPSECVPAGEVLRLHAQVANVSEEAVEILPVFVPSEEGLSLQFNCQGERSRTGSLVTEITPDEKLFHQLAPNQFIGQRFELSYLIEHSLLYPEQGIPVGNCSVQARLKTYVSEVGGAVSSDDLLSPVEQLCLKPASENRIKANLSALESDEIENMLNGVRFFISVADARSVEPLHKLRSKSSMQAFRRWFDLALQRQGV